ncbi:unnamed protein product [Parnassius mnemosyne]|uniref:Uncharacterized protein n=1 Tax=Parnassius mnemosyne TaxID=213953 RepID=A0AAV1LQB8_9NEOP
MGPEIISVIERHLGHLVDGMMCSQCFAIIMQEMSNDSVLAHGDHELSVAMIAMFMLGVGHLCLGRVLTRFPRVQKGNILLKQLLQERYQRVP